MLLKNITQGEKAKPFPKIHRKGVDQCGQPLCSLAGAIPFNERETFPFHQSGRDFLTKDSINFLPPRFLIASSLFMALDLSGCSSE